MAAIPQGAIRFNTDSQKLEFYAQDQWWEMVIDTPDLGVSSNTGAGARGVFGGGANPGNINVIDYITISSTGNALDFGDLTISRRDAGSCSSSSRGIFNNGAISPISEISNVIDYITISSTGNAIDFGDLTVIRRGTRSVSSATRGLFAGGNNDSNTDYNTIDYITISSTGNAVDFGDLLVGRSTSGSCSSSTRGVFAGGFDISPTYVNFNIIDYVTIATLGNSIDFGDLTSSRDSSSGCSNSIRGLFGGGRSITNLIDYITIATLGNAVKFGDMTISRYTNASCASPTRGLFGGGYVPPAGTNLNIIDYVTISVQGNAVDFGDLTVARQQTSACSNAHGGL